MNPHDQTIRIKAARIRLVRDKVFFGAIAMRLELISDEKLQTLAATDGRRLLYNPNLLADVDSQQLVGLVAHEALHTMLMHTMRMKGRHHKKWNIATDHAINLLLLEEGFKLPAGGCFDAKYKGMSAEKIYELLPDNPSEQGFDQLMPGDSDMSEKDVRIAEEQMKAAVVNAAALARKAGTMTSGIEALVEAICEPKANWQTQLLEFVSQAAANDFDWARPSQRHLHQYGIFCPTLNSRDKLGSVGILNDTSGSTWNYQEQFASEISDILAQYDCTVTVINHNTQIKSVDEYSSDDLPISLSVKGLGGTRFDTAYRYVSEEHDFDVLIHLTDGEADWRDVDAPGCPVLVACCNRSMIKYVPGWARVLDIG